MAVSGEDVPEAETDVGDVLETYEVEDVERLETEPEAVLSVESESAPEPVVEDEVETLLSDLGSTDVQQTEEPDTLESTTDDQLVGVFVSDPSVHVSEEDATAIDELFEEMEEETPGGDAGAQTTSSDGLELVGSVGTERRVSTEESGIDEASEALQTDSSDETAPAESAPPETEPADEQSVSRTVDPLPGRDDRQAATTHPASGLSDRVGQLLGDAAEDEAPTAAGESDDQESRPAVEDYSEEYSEAVTEALSAAEAEIDEYKSNVLYDAHPNDTEFEWVADDEVSQC